MSGADLAGAAIVVALSVFVIGAGLVAAGRLGRAMLARRERTVERLADRGTVYGSDAGIRVALLIVWMGGALGSLCLLPGAVWAIEGDPDARRAALGLAAVGAVFVGLGVLVSLPGQTVVVLEDDRLTKVGLRRERSVRFAAVTSVVESRRWPSTVVIGDGRRIRLGRTTAGFDDLFNRLAASVPAQALARDQALAPDQADGAGPPRARDPDPSAGTATVEFTVRARVIRAAGGGLGGLLVALVAWPWFLVGGDHPTRDAWIFCAMGIGLWAVIALLVQAESFPHHQPVEISLSPQRIVWRPLRGERIERPANELVSASVETTIVYVRRQPGHRYPLRLRFVDGTTVEIGDRRARQLGASTQHLAAAVRRTCLDVGTRPPEDREVSDRALRAADDAAAIGEVGEAGREIDQLLTAIARWPDPSRWTLHRRVADRLHRAGRTDEAIGHYRAHLDVFPDDAVAWQELAACLPGGYQSELRDETVALAEQLLLSGRAREPLVEAPGRDDSE